MLSKLFSDVAIIFQLTNISVPPKARAKTKGPAKSQSAIAAGSVSLKGFNTDKV